ncbi:protocadherin Fat 4-like, partial [Paramuricea clavata]
DARIYRSLDLGNVAELNRFGSGALISGALKDSCLVAPYNCAEGITVSFWLQFISGGIIIRTGKAGFHVYVEDGKFFITYQGVGRSWTIERGCIPMDVFLVTATWSAAEGLSYYENGKLVVSTQISDPSSISENFNDVITVGYEETSSGKRYSSIIIDDLMIWNRALISENVQTIHSYGVLTSFDRGSCLSDPCESGSWCFQGRSSTQHACIQPTSSDCSFEDGLCNFSASGAAITTTNNQSAIAGNFPFHEHTFGICRARDPPAKFLRFVPICAHQGSSSQLIADYDSKYEFSLLGLGEAYNEVSLERKNWLTGQYAQSSAQMNSGSFENFYISFTGVYDKCRCAQTGRHRFKVRTNGVNISYYDFETLRLRDPDPPKSVTVTHNGTSRVQVMWNSPGCNGGPVRGVRVSMYSANSTTYFERNETMWNSFTGAGSFIITDHEFEVNAEYNWTVAVLYDYGNGTVWSQESSILSTMISVEFAVKLSLHDGNSYQELPTNDGTYIIERGQSLVLFCNVTSITWPQRTWSKRTYQGYEAVQSQEFQPEFSSSGFGWTSTINIPQFNYTDSGNYSCSGAAGSNHGIDYATLYINARLIVVTTSIMPENYIVPYHSTFKAEIILQGSSTVYNPDLQIVDWRTGKNSSNQGLTFVEIRDGYLKLTAQYNSFECSNTGVHRTVLELEDYSQFEYELSRSLLISDPDPPQITSVIGISESAIKLTWSAGQCDMGYPREISISVFKRNGELFKQNILNITSYNESTGAGVTLVEKGQDFNTSYTEWIIDVLYNGTTEPVWSRPSPDYFATISGAITISFVSNSSSSLLAYRTPVGHIIKRNESVTITCQTLAAGTSSNFTWTKKTFANQTTLSGNNIRSWNEGEYLYGSVTLDYFDYTHCGVYSCQVNMSTDRCGRCSQEPEFKSTPW